MIHPLIVLENHFSVGSRQFITDNAAVFKELGYTKFLFEMNHEISPETMKQQIMMILSNPAASAYHASSKSLFDMLISLETNKITYEFIDPETQEEATQQNLKLQSAARAGNVATAIAERERLTARRDEIMSSEIIKQSEQHDGGIIFLAGFHHKHLVHLLESNQHDFYRYALFTDSRKDQHLSRMSPVGNEGWGDLPNEKFRTQFYQTRVQFFDLAMKPSFEMIEAECRLTNYKMCEPPAVGMYLSKATKQDYSFIVDSHHVVTATAAMEIATLKETVGSIKRDFPGLRFFTEQKGMHSVLNIPGINLPENHACLKEGFVKLGVMKT